MPSLQYSFEGKRVLVTGGGRGIGRAIVQKFYDDGAVVFVIDVDAKRLKTLKNELPKVTTICVDLLQWDETKNAVEALAPLDHLVNNAGIAGEGPLMEARHETIAKVFGVNWSAVLNVSQAFVQGIVTKKGNGGTIVNISSIADRLTLPGIGVYSSAKAALTTLTKSMALEFGDKGIRANCIGPGHVNTDLPLEMDPALMQQAQMILQRTILKHRLIEASDIADSVLFLSSPLSSMITGQALIIDAGLTVG